MLSLSKLYINILKKYKVTGVIHSFSGSLEMAKEYIKLGFYLGVNGVITFKNCKLIDVYKKLVFKIFYLKRIVLIYHRFLLGGR